MLTRKFLFPLILFLTASISYVFFSYSLTAPNLVLSSWQPYWSFQTWMWETFFNDRDLLSKYYFLIITILWISYGWLIFLVNKNFNKLKLISIQFKICLIFLVSMPFLLASSALSYDIFNYIFNAKMLTFYKVNPHVSVALDFAYDPWVRFMHNIHTPAPYGYGWTVLSLLPFLLGFGKLLLTWVNFKLFSWLSYLLLAGIYIWQLKSEWWKSLVILLNPLLLIEVIGNSHNDLWMLVPAIASLLLISNLKTINSKTIVLTIVLLSISISIKLATLVLSPIFILLLISKLKIKLPTKLRSIIFLIATNWPFFASLSLFAPLFLERSKWFLPWYLIWALVWIPLITITKNTHLYWFKKIYVSFLIGFSVSSLYRYLPFLLAGNYDLQVVPQQIATTWIAGLILGSICFLLSLRFKDAR